MSCSGRVGTTRLAGCAAFASHVKDGNRKRHSTKGNELIRSGGRDDDDEGRVSTANHVLPRNNTRDRFKIHMLTHSSFSCKNRNVIPSSFVLLSYLPYSSSFGSSSSDFPFVPFVTLYPHIIVVMIISHSDQVIPLPSSLFRGTARASWSCGGG